MTYVTWCPICNQWAPEMLKQISSSIEDKPVVLVAVCTDKGAAEGKAFLQQKGLTGPNVFYAAAPKMNETFAMDPKNLWNFAYIGPKGVVKKTGQAGAAYTNTDPKKYVIPFDLEMDKNLGSMEFVDAGMSVAVKALVWQLELGDMSVLQRIAQPKNLRGLSKEDQASLKDLSTKFLDTQVETIKSMSAGEMATKIEAYEKGSQFVAQFKTTAQGKEITKIVNELNSAPTFKKEVAAKKLYSTTVTKASGNETQLNKMMHNVALRYPDTYFGELAKSRADGTYKTEEVKTDDSPKAAGVIVSAPKSESPTKSDAPAKADPAVKGDGAAKKSAE